MLPVRLEHAALVGLGFVLPLLEAPKNLLWLAYLCLWVFNRARSGDFGGAWDRWDTVIALWIGSGFLSIPLGGLGAGDWTANNDVLRYGSLLWLMKRSRYDTLFLNQVFVALVAGTLVTLAWGYYGVLVTKDRYHLGLNSVGHVNHSAIYVAIVFGAALGALRAAWASSTPQRRTLGAAVLLLLAVSLFVMRSRGALVAAVVVALVLAGAYAWRLGRGLRSIAICAALFASAAIAVVVVKPELFEKRDAFGTKLPLVSQRDVIGRTALAAWREFPFFGVGTDNFSRIGFDDLERWSARRAEPFDRARYELAPHSHSLYLNTLAERGLLGLLALAALLLVWLVELRKVPQANAPPAHWTWWAASASAWLVTVFAGAVNTTLHHEHALLGVLLLGGWLSLKHASDSPG